ncbi:MAG TPA: crosslink repair DNA glycosylase YcaQ family protein [Stellaceae bacterium]|nr:crosslink repair DNA glycosylase YcaQ family protein [Stellaceae bacterium]
MQRLGCVQLDSIATVERSHLLVLGSRIGAIEPGSVSRLLATGRLFEYWAHEACLMAAEDWPLMRRRMRERRVHHWWGPVIAADPALATRVIAEIRERGPLGSRHFEGEAGTGMWRRKPAKQMLDALWTAGELMVCGRQGFQRLYDLPERILPASVLGAKIPSEKETIRGLVFRAVESRGALTARGVVEHYRLSGGTARIKPHLAALCREGRIEERRVADDGLSVYLPAGAKPESADPRRTGVLLSPFENLLWDRDFTQRLFGFNHLIEIYKRAHERRYGYYVLPFLFGDRLVGRADLKTNRDAQAIEVRAFHLEPGVRRSGAIEASFARALKRLAQLLFNNGARQRWRRGWDSNPR